MSLDKSIASGDEHRKPHRRSAAFDPSCRVGGDCPFCRSNRTIQEQRAHAAADDAEQDALCQDHLLEMAFELGRHHERANPGSDATMDDVLDRTLAVDDGSREMPEAEKPSDHGSTNASSNTNAGGTARDGEP